MFFFPGVIIFLLDLILMVILKVILVMFIFSSCDAFFDLALFILFSIIVLNIISVRSLIMLQVADVGVNHSYGCQWSIVFRRRVVFTVIYIILFLFISIGVGGVVLVAISYIEEGSSVAILHV